MTAGSLPRIAVVGMAGRFPGASDVDSFWRNLRDGVESITFFGDEELEAAGVPRATLQDPKYVKARAVLEDVDLFDAAFFQLTPREAELLDPQHRLFLECAWQALEDAAHDPERFEGSIGLYAGVGSSNYLRNSLDPQVLADAGGAAVALGNDRDFFATRVSYKLNLTGPSLTLQTACSTSLVAVHMACQGLLTCQCDMALAGGVTIKLPQRSGHVYQEGGIYSPDGHCRVFDRSAQGTVGGSGVGVVVLRRLEDALAQGDRVYAVILASAVNNDGSAKVGYTAPSVAGQAEAIATAQALAQVDVETITYVEAHGTGTPLGDPIELLALTKAFRASTERRGFCALGSVKSNVGHLDAAAGVAGLIKTALALHHRQIPPSLHFRQPNPALDLADSPFYVSTELTEWPASRAPRRAGVSSFGIGGSNAHVVLEEAPAAEPTGPSRPWRVLTLSGRTSTALEAAIDRLAAHLGRHPEQELADVAYTCQLGRRAFEHRCVLVCQDEAATVLARRGPERFFSRRCEPGDRPVVFLIPGQGSQYPDMGRELYELEATFRQDVDACSDLLEPHLKIDLRRVLYPRGRDLDEAARRLQQTSLTQPALFVVEYALARLWMSWGVKPRALIGHSVGEYLAACLSGVMSLDDALKLVAARGRLIEGQPPGAMLGVALSPQELGLLVEPLSLAAINARRMVVVSGPEEAIVALEGRLAERGVESTRLRTSRAFHSPMMDPVLEPFREQLEQVRLRPPQIPFVSNVTGTWISAEEAMAPAYWVRHLREPVRFADGIAEVLREPSRVLLEVGPGQSLGSLARQDPQCDAGRTVLASLRQPGHPASDVSVLLTALGRLWLAGAPVDWSAFHQGERRRRVSLPTYPFERRSYWIGPAGKGSGPAAERTRERSGLRDWFYLPTWKQLPVSLRSASGRAPGPVLLFVGPEGVGSELTARLEAAGRRVSTVRAGTRFEVLEGNRYTIDAGREGDYQSLLAELARRREWPSQIVHLWGVADRTAGRVCAEPLEHVLATGFYSLLFLGRALAGRRDGRIDLAVVSQGIYDVTGVEHLEPEKATALGPCRVIPQEISHVACRHIDIASPAAEGSSLEALWAELLAPAEPVVALRGGFRWLPGFEKAPVDAPSSVWPLRQRGVYLITGGLGGLGLELAAYLAGAVSGRIALIGRQGLPPRDQWAQRVAESGPRPEVAMARRIRRVQALEESGAEVLVLAADCGDRRQMSDALEHVRRRFGDVNGVIHAAGVAGGGLIELKTAEAAHQVLAPKLEGAVMLEELLGGSSLDFLVLFSSLSSLMGGVGQVDYCAANAFLDAFAQRRRRSGRLTVSINWDAWSEVGMAAAATASADVAQRGEAASRDGISPQEGVEAFRRALSLGVPRVVVSARDLDAEMARRRRLPGLEPPPSQAGPPSRHARPELDSPYRAPRSETEKELAEIWQAVLGIERVGIDDDFSGLGGHSLLATQIVARVRRVFGVDLPLRALFETPTLAQLALVVIDHGAMRAEEHALEEMVSRLERLSEADVEQELREHGPSPVRGGLR